MPVLSSRKLPVPYVFFASPTAKHVCPNVAACWSPRSPASGTPVSAPDFTSPYTSLDALISGSIARGTPITSMTSWSQSRVRRSISIVRLALVTSVMCRPPSGPPVRFQMTQVSMLPNSRSPESAFAAAPSTLSSSQRIFGPEKYVASGSPTFSWKRAWPPSREYSSTSLSVRVSCQTSALWIGLPVVLSQTTDVSRWLVMPTPATSSALAPAADIASSTTSCVRAQISSTSCSTQPGLG